MILNLLKISSGAGVILPMAIFAASCNKISPFSHPTPADSMVTAKPGYSLVWSDEFNGNSVDTTK